MQKNFPTEISGSFAVAQNDIFVCNIVLDSVCIGKGGKLHRWFTPDTDKAALKKCGEQFIQRP